MANDTTKIRMTPNTLSGSTDDQPDVAKLTFSTSSITSSLPLFVNDEKVLSQNKFLNFDETKGALTVDKVYVQTDFMVDSKHALLQSEDLKVADGIVSATNINVSGKASVGSISVSGAKVLTQNQFLTFDDITGTLNANYMTANEMKVKGRDVLFSSPDLSWDEATGTLTVKNLKVIGTMELENS